MSRLKGAIYGFAVGDALGVPFEFKTRGSFNCTEMIGYGTYDQPAGTWSDDTSMTLATCAAIKQTGRVDVGAISANFHKWYFDNEFNAGSEWFDVGHTTQDAIEYGVAHDGENSNGNGSIMRILPLAFTDATADDIENVSAITHAHDISKVSCVILVEYARLILKGSDKIESLRPFELIEPFHRISRLSELDEPSIRSTGYVVDTLEAAMWCFITTENYRDCVLKAVNLGGDTDTIAAIAGGLAGLLYGIEDIPEEWLRQLRNKELIEKCLF